MEEDNFRYMVVEAVNGFKGSNKKSITKETPQRTSFVVKKSNPINSSTRTVQVTSPQTFLYAQTQHSVL